MTDAREVRHRLQQIRFSLGVIAVDHIDIGVKHSVQMDIISEKIQT